MTELDMSNVDCPEGAAQVRDLIAQMLKSQVDHGSSMDTGGGFGAADLWVSFGGTEYYVSVKISKPAQSLVDKFRGIV